jgi:hypothetical protein
MNTPTTEQAVSLDEYINHLREGFMADDLLRLRRHLPALKAKGDAARAAGHRELVAGVEVLAAILGSSVVETCTDPLPVALTEAGAAAAYLLKGIDLIPDSLPRIGLSDDEWIVARVLERNPELLKIA